MAISNEKRDYFLEVIYNMFSDEPTNEKANEIIDIFDTITDNCIDLPNYNKDEIVGSTPEQPEVTEENLRKEWVAFKQKEQSGLLIDLPCKVGDNIFIVGKYIEGIKILSVKHFKVNEDCVALYSDPWDGMICEAHQIGKVVKEQFDWNGYFLSEEEAKQALTNKEAFNETIDFLYKETKNK